MSDLLKSMLQDLINDRTEQAQVTLHDYLVQKTQEAAGLAEAKGGKYIVAKVGFTSTDSDGKDKDDFAFISFRATSAKEEMEHVKDCNWEDVPSVNMDHIVQNVSGGSYVPGSAHTISVSTADGMPDGRRHFSAKAGDVLAA